MTEPELSLYGMAEAELVAEMGLDAEHLTPSDRRRLATATALSLKIDADQRRLRDGEPVDLAAHVRDQDALTALLEPAAGSSSDGIDLTKCSDAELAALETASRIMNGEHPKQTAAFDKLLAERQAELDRERAAHMATIKSLNHARGVTEGQLAAAERVEATAIEKLKGEVSRLEALTIQQADRLETAIRLLEHVRPHVPAHIMAGPLPPSEPAAPSNVVTLPRGAS